MRLYAHLGRRLAAHARAEGGGAADNPYAEWVSTYSSDEFEALAARLEALLEWYAPPESEATLGETYETAMQLEFDFFDAVWNAD